MRTIKDIISSFPKNAVREVEPGSLPRNHIAFFVSSDGYPYRVAVDSQTKTRLLDWEQPLP